MEYPPGLRYHAPNDGYGADCGWILTPSAPNLMVVQVVSITVYSTWTTAAGPSGSRNQDGLRIDASGGVAAFDDYERERVQTVGVSGEGGGVLFGNPLFSSGAGGLALTWVLSNPVHAGHDDGARYTAGHEPYGFRVRVLAGIFAAS